MDQPSGLPMVLILETRSHLDLGDLPNMLAAELGVMTVRLERAVRSLDGVARVHVNRWGDGSAHLHLWFMARPYGRLQLRGSFLSMWDEILPPVAESTWREDLAMIAAWLAEFGGQALAQPPRIEWKAPAKFGPDPVPSVALAGRDDTATTENGGSSDAPTGAGAAEPATVPAGGAAGPAPGAADPGTPAGSGDAGQPADGTAAPARRPEPRHPPRESPGRGSVKAGVPAGPSPAEAEPAATAAAPATAAPAVDSAVSKG
jgi:hypothetical protein